MNRSLISHRWMFSLAIVLVLLLAACERPLQEDVEDMSGDDFSLELAPEDQIYDPTTLPFPPVVPTRSLLETGVDSELTGESTAVEEPGEPPEAPEAVPQVVYEVKAGDTLMRIAQQYNVSVDDIVAANSLVSADVLDIGQQLVIPVEGVVAAEASDATLEEPDSALEEASGPIHVVQPGDNLYRIGLLYGCPHQEIAAYNNLANPDSLEIGQVVRIPLCE